MSTRSRGELARAVGWALLGTATIAVIVAAAASGHPINVNPI
jgi:hypothetical protein